MYVNILYDNSTEALSEEGKSPKLLPSQEDTLSQAKEVEKALLELGYKTRKIEIVYEHIEDLIDTLLKHRGDVVFNLCEDIKGEGIYESYVASLLELLDIAYTGSDPLALSLCLHKGHTQKLLASQNLPTPAHFVFETGEERAPRNLRFPVITKLVHEDGSMGIERDSVVQDEKALRHCAKRMIQRYHQPVIAESYIEGREFNISILGNGKKMQILPIAEIDYTPLKSLGPKILTYTSKWNEDSPEYRKTVPICPAPLALPLEKKIKRIAYQAVQALGCRDYARVDIRMQGKLPYIIEVNPNPCIASDAGFIRSAKASGLSYSDVVHQIVSFAIARKEEKDRQENVWPAEGLIAS